jgi:hypothetical protein
MGAAVDVSGVVDRMRGMADAFPAGDGVGVFHRVYLSVTSEVSRRLAAGWFADETAAGDLAARFADRYLSAVEDAAAGRRPPACWRPLLRMRSCGGVHPLQFAGALRSYGSATYEGPPSVRGLRLARGLSR